MKFYIRNRFKVNKKTRDVKIIIIFKCLYKKYYINKNKCLIVILFELNQV